MTDFRTAGEQNQARYIARDKADFEAVCAMVREFIRANGLTGEIDPIDFSAGRLPSREIHVAVNTAEEIRAWDKVAKPYQLAVYNGLRHHPANLPITDEEEYLLVRNSNSDGVIGGEAADAPQPVPEGWTLWLRYYPQGRTILSFPRSDVDLVPGRGNSFSIPSRRGLKPHTSTVVPHLQMTDASPAEIREELLDWIKTSPELARGRKIGPSDVAEPTSIAYFIDADIVSPRSMSMAPSIRESGYEAFHVHEDGGLHIALSPDDRWEILVKGWGETHPVARWGVNAILLYAPRDAKELEIIKTILIGAYRYAMGELEEVAQVAVAAE